MGGVPFNAGTTWLAIGLAAFEEAVHGMEVTRAMREERSGEQRRDI